MFIPVLFMGGIVGRLLHEFAVTIGVAILVSGFVSISLTPMLCSRFLRPPHAQRHGALYNCVRADVRRLAARLRLHAGRQPALSSAVTMAVSVVLFVGTVYLFMIVPKGFLPSEDQGRFNVSTEAAQGIGFDDMVRHQHEVAEIVMDDPDVDQHGGQRRPVGNNAAGGGEHRPHVASS